MSETSALGVQGVSCCLWGSVVHADAICGTLGSSRPVCISCWMEGSGQIRGSRDCISQVALSCGRTLTLVYGVCCPVRQPLTLGQGHTHMPTDPLLRQTAALHAADAQFSGAGVPGS